MDDMNFGNPRVLIVGLEKDSDTLIKNIVQESKVPSLNRIESDVKNEYIWRIQNKYYTANVNLAGIDYQWGDAANNYPIVEKVEALAVYFNNDHHNAIDGLIKLEEYLNKYDTEVKVIICDKFSNNESEHRKIIDWCLTNNFEYIDLIQEPDSTDETDDTDIDDFNDTKGIQRVIEVLQVHVWSNAEMIDKKSTNSNDSNDILEQDLDEFCELFTQLHTLKEGIQNLPRQQRLECAEQVISKFWQAINGSDDELSDDILEVPIKP